MQTRLTKSFTSRPSLPKYQQAENGTDVRPEGFSTTGIYLRPLAQFERGEAWRLTTLHDRPDYLMIWITKGQGLALLSGIRVGVGAHTALLIPPETLFSLDLMRGAGALVLTMPASLAEELTMPHRPHVLRLRDVQTQAEVTHRLEAIHREATATDDFASDAVQAHVALLSVAMRRFLVEVPEASNRPGAHRLSEAYCSLVALQYHTPQSMADYARTLGVTATHLTRSCKEACGMTAADMLSARSLYAARDMIEQSDLSLKEISKRLSFGSPAYFSRFILKHTGQSPSTLRKAARGRPSLAS